MSKKRLLLLSNSTNYGKGYLEHAVTDIADFLGDSIHRVLFIPYAGIRISYDDYAQKVAVQFGGIGYKLEAIHRMKDLTKAIEQAQAIAIGGGNTFHLLHELYRYGLLDPIRKRVEAGLPFMGWSAGSNVAGLTIKTTNDMPIVEPPSFEALGLVPFQINPHYTDAQLPHHQGETREERLLEFIEANPDTHVLALREGSLVRIEGATIQLIGNRPARVFKKGQEIQEIEAGGSFQLNVALGVV